MIKRLPTNRAFTLIELIVSVAIFSLMTAFLMAKYGTFNQSTLLNNLAYDTALTIRNAQAYALNVASASNGASVSFYNAYGVHFESTTSFVFYVNAGADAASVTAAYNPSTSQVLNIFTFKAGNKIDSICVQAESPCQLANTATTLDIAFKRPNPDAIMITTVQGAPATASYAQIALSASDGSTKKIIVRSTGQISVSN